MVDAPSTSGPITWPEIVDEDQWRQRLQELLLKEKELTAARDALAAQRRRMPMTPVHHDYSFEGPDGRLDLLEMFEGRHQLIVYRFFYAPDVENWPEGACSGCSLFADSLVHPAHLNARDTTFAMVSTASQDLIARYRARMGWHGVPWYTMVDSDFEQDFDVPEFFGFNVFVRDHDQVYRSYFTNARAVETLGPLFPLLDLTPLGRQESWEDSPAGRPQGEPYVWWDLHDQYSDAHPSGHCCAH